MTLLTWVYYGKATATADATVVINITPSYQQTLELLYVHSKLSCAAKTSRCQIALGGTANYLKFIELEDIDEMNIPCLDYISSFKQIHPPRILLFTNDVFQMAYAVSGLPVPSGEYVTFFIRGIVSTAAKPTVTVGTNNSLTVTKNYLAGVV